MTAKSEYAFYKGMMFINDQPIPVVVGCEIDREQIIKIAGCHMNPADYTIKTKRQNQVVEEQSILIDRDGLSFTVTYTGPIL